jgi:conjugal transfer/entry exclusion protein
MTPARRMLILAGLLLCMTAGDCHTQTLVLDVANLAQTTITAIEEVLSVANQILELTPLGGIEISSDYASDMADLTAIASEARALSNDLGSLQAQLTSLFGLSGAPTSSRELRRRIAAIRAVVADAYLYAVRAQTLTRTTISAVQHLTRLVSAIADFVGNQSANQSLAQYDAALNATLAKLQVQTAAFEKAQAAERLEDALVMESLENISTEIMRDWPR